MLSLRFISIEFRSTSIKIESREYGAGVSGLSGLYSHGCLKHLLNDFRTAKTVTVSPWISLGASKIQVRLDSARPASAKGEPCKHGMV